MPSRGSAVLAANHASHLDHFFIEMWLRRHPHFMAKSQLYANRMVRAFLKYGATFPVRRGREDEDAFESARIILEGGGLVITYPEGGRTRTGRLGEPRRGVGRIALESGAPVVPVAIHGSVHARSWRRNWPRLRFPAVTVWFGEPLRFEREDRPGRERQQEVAEQIFDSIRRMHGLLEEALTSNRRGRVLRAARRGELGSYS